MRCSLPYAYIYFSRQFGPSSQIRLTLRLINAWPAAAWLELAWAASAGELARKAVSAQYRWQVVWAAVCKSAIWIERMHVSAITDPCSAVNAVLSDVAVWPVPAFGDVA